MKDKPNYGNWVSKRMMNCWWLISAVSLLVSAAVFCPFVGNWPEGILITARILFPTLTIVLIAVTVYMGICRRLFSYTGGRVSAKILDYVLSCLEWDGQGRLLDIGCGSGALSVKAAQKYPEAAVTGIDYWGTIWDFAKEQCESNAAAEGVAERTVFQKGDAASLPFPDGCFDAAVSNFVFHEVRSQPDKRQLVREALRVVRKGGAFAFHDLFLQKSLYGDIEEFVQELKEEGISEIRFFKSRDEEFVPAILKAPSMLGNIGLLCGKK